MPAIMFIVVDLPQPEGPSSAMNSPSAMVRSIVFSAVKLPKCFTRFSRRIALMLATRLRIAPRCRPTDSTTRIASAMAAT